MDLKRDVGPSLLRSLATGCQPIILAYLDWPGAPVYAHTGYQSIQWNGHTWRGVGDLASISLPPESAGQAANEATLELVGSSPTLDGYADDNIRNRSVELYLGAFPLGGGDSMVGTPSLLFSGTMDLLTLVDEASGGVVSSIAQLTVMTGVEARSKVTAYHSDEDQRYKYPGDTAGRHTILAFAKAQKFQWPEN